VASAGQSPCGASSGGALTPSTPGCPAGELGSHFAGCRGGVRRRRPGGLARGACGDVGGCDALCHQRRRARPRGLGLGPNGLDLGSVGGLEETAAAGPDMGRSSGVVNLVRLKKMGGAGAGMRMTFGGGVSGPIGPAGSIWTLPGLLAAASAGGGALAALSWAS
jgi:hypothetical protein